MISSAIVQRELRIALHRPELLKLRFCAAVVAATVAGSFLLFEGTGGSGVGGSPLRGVLFLLCFGAATYAPVLLGCSLFSDERRSSALGLVYLTGLSSSRVFVSKVVGGALVAASQIWAILPVLSFPAALFGRTSVGMRQRLIDQLRAVVQDPIPDLFDPRLKSWDSRERLPPARISDQFAQLHMERRRPRRIH